MKKNQRKEIQEKTVPELLADGRNMRQEIFNLRLQQASERLIQAQTAYSLAKWNWQHVQDAEYIQQSEVSHSVMPFSLS